MKNRDQSFFDLLSRFLYKRAGFLDLLTGIFDLLSCLIYVSKNWDQSILDLLSGLPYSRGLLSGVSLYITNGHYESGLWVLSLIRGVNCRQRWTYIWKLSDGHRRIKVSEWVPHSLDGGVIGVCPFGLKLILFAWVSRVEVDPGFNLFFGVLVETLPMSFPVEELGY